MLVGMVACGCVEMLGATLSSVAITRDWVPVAWGLADPAALGAINSAMASIDLGAEIAGPLAAGVALQVSSHGLCRSMG
jgi:hypothetical protein